MLLWFEIILLIASLWYLVYTDASTQRWAIVMASVFVILTIFPVFPWLLILLMWISYALVAIFFKLPKQRYKFITLPLLHKLRKLLPHISETEQIAIEAGDVWWEGELFRGKPNWQKLLSLQNPKLTHEEQAFLDQQTEKLCQMLDDWDIVHNRKDLPKEVWDYLKKEKFFGLVIPKEYGGLGFSSYGQSVIVTKVASRSLSAAVNIMVPNSLGPAELIAWFGTDEQKKYYLPRMAVGEELPCFALTGLEAGSDAGAMKDYGVVCRGMFEGKETLGVRLNWDKRYITLAPITTLIGLAFKLRDPDHLLSEQENRGITICVVPTHLPGVEVGPRHYPVGLAFMNGPARGKDVFVPLHYIIGGQEMIGRGWHILMEALSAGRGISLPALASAVAKSSFRTTSAYVNLRKQFNTAIGNFEGIALKLAEIVGLNYLTEATRRLTLTAIDQEIKPSLATAISKYHTTEMARKIINDAMDIHAGRGIQLGPKNYLAFSYFGAPVCITVEGANILTRNLIIFGQGAVRCHPYIRKEIEALSNKDVDQAVVELDKLLREHFSSAASNFARTLFYGLTGARFITVPVTGHLAKYYRQLTRMSAALAITADFAMLSLGGDLKRREALSARLGDVLSYLYLASAVLKFGHDKTNHVTEVDVVQWSLDYCLNEIQIAFKELFKNLPSKWMSCLLSFIIFPWGYRYHKPTDTVSLRLAKYMMFDAAFRDRMTEYCFISQDAQDVTGSLEVAYQKLTQINPLLTRLQDAIKDSIVKKSNDFDTQLALALKANVLTQDEVKLLQDFERMRLDTLQVDQFDTL